MTSSPPGDTSTTAGDETTTGSTSEGSESSGDTTGPPPPSFECPPTDNQCSLQEQDCPQGFKCILWDAEGDLVEPDATICAPVDESPAELYANCTNDIATCTDDCPGGAACLPFYDDGGTCLDLCDANDECPGDQVCQTCGSCAAAWCVPTCDPLAPDCPETLGDCVLDGSFGQVAFSCQWELGPAGLGDPCFDVSDCAQGLMCTEQEDLGPGCLDPACCTELCDLDDPAAVCSDPAHVCVPLFIPGQALPSQEHIGKCALPEAHPCAEPSFCPPPGIDDGAYAWCSVNNENFCTGIGIFGLSSALDCIQQCFCVDNCAVDADCPAPATGTAAPICLDQGPGTENDRCVLPCGGGEVCPDGMVCSAAWGDICMWESALPSDECI
ncbi:hypothetical protein [Paraliomyxa miuraensis]|uniref:hypothetical protein n=1 Tax=Paraliomyxa miuraensis TaxID=376150 RepID=UPI002256F42A|nr:hypothetical protein [Paraliomyxa miuraensis]MCX4246312.1 hypothetical protein [Paraliomyxa miuraensis]